RLLHSALLGSVAALVALTNAWDVPLLAGLLLLVTLIAAFSGPRISLSAILRAASGGAIAAGAAFVTSVPFWVRTGQAPGIGRSVETARGVDALLVFGLFFLLALAGGLDFLSARLEERGFDRLSRSVVVGAFAAALAAAAALSINLFLVLGVLFFLFAAVALAETSERRLIFGLLATAFFLVFFAQYFYIYDRMNTFFKL